MPELSADALAPWHDFYTLLGTGAVTLIGAMFVVASIGTGILTHERSAETATFLTPTVLHLSTVLFACALTLVPGVSTVVMGMLFCAAGIIGLAYSALIWGRTQRRNLVLVDRLWYALVPVAGYGAMVAASILTIERRTASLDVGALALVLLLIAGIRNAWDLILYFVAQNSRRL